MNKTELSDIQFIMSLTAEQFDQWSNDLSDDDTEYAINIIKKYREEMLNKEDELMVADLSEARKVLNQFKLKKD